MKKLAAVVAVLVAAFALLVACDGGVPGPGASNVDVDTPELRAQKAAAGIEDCEPGSGEAGSGGLPEIALPCLGGGPDVDLSTLKGPLLVNLWYSACGPCREEMPLLQRLHETGQVTVVGIDVETYPDAAISFADSIGATYPQIADPGKEIFEERDLPLTAAYPQTIFVDAEGNVDPEQIEAGEIESYDELLELVRDRLGVTVSAP